MRILLSVLLLSAGFSFGATDKLGVNEIYPDAAKPFFSESTGGGKAEYHNYASGGGSWRREWEITAPHLNAEVTAYFLVTEKKEDTISVKLRGAKHTGDEFNACNYIHYVPFSAAGPYIGKQCPHTSYYEAKGIVPKFALGDIRGQWIGVKSIEWNEGPYVHLQTWIDIGLKTNQWKLWVDTVDSGNIGLKDALEPFTRSPWRGNLPATVLLRVDTKAVDAQLISLRAITAPGDLPPPPPPPPPPSNQYRILKYITDGIWGIEFDSTSPGLKGQMVNK